MFWEPSARPAHNPSRENRSTRRGYGRHWCPHNNPATPQSSFKCGAASQDVDPWLAAFLMCFRPSPNLLSPNPPSTMAVR
jgi:hypothetical protein